MAENTNRLRPAGHRLRLARVSMLGQTYSVTVCCHGREALLASEGVRDCVAATVIEAVPHCFDRLDAHVVMPNHLHLVFAVGRRKSLDEAVRDLKKITARRANELLGRSGPFWQKGYYEHALRCQEDYDRHLQYVMENPVRKGLCARLEEYRWAQLGPWYAERND